MMMSRVSCTGDICIYVTEQAILCYLALSATCHSMRFQPLEFSCVSYLPMYNEKFETYNAYPL